MHKYCNVWLPVCLSVVCLSVCGCGEGRGGIIFPSRTYYVLGGVYDAVVSAVYLQSKYCGFDPRRIRSHTSFFPSLSLGIYQPPNVYIWVCSVRTTELSLAKKQPL